MTKSEPSFGVKNIHSNKWLIASCFLVFIISYGFTTMFVTGRPIGSPLAKWEPLSIPEEYYDDSGFTEIEFINSTHGWLIGFEALLQTSDGGESWSACLTLNGITSYRLSIVTPVNIWVSGTSLLRHTIDGGVTWEYVNTPNAAVSRAEFYNTTHGILADSHGLYRTFDGGISWQSSINWSSEYNSIRDFDLSGTSARIATSSGFYLSEDWGLTWTVEDSRSIRGLSFITDDEGWILHPQFISHQVNGTLFDLPRVERIQVPSNSYYNDIEFIDSDHGWVVGSGPAVIYTPDGGNSWYEQECPDYHFRSVHFINETHGWAAGSSGAVARTVTGNSLGPHLPSGFLLSFGFTGGGVFVPYISVLVGTVSTMVCVFLIFIIWRKILMNRYPHHERVQIR